MSYVFLSVFKGFHLSVYRVWQKSNPKIFCSFLSNCLEFQTKMLPTYLVILYTHKSIISI